VVVSDRRVAGRSAGDHVGEMAAVQPAQEKGLRLLLHSKTQSLPSSRRRFSRISVPDTPSFIA
jgi:hypothetical protein